MQISVAHTSIVKEKEIDGEFLVIMLIYKSSWRRRRWKKKKQTGSSLFRTEDDCQNGKTSIYSSTHIHGHKNININTTETMRRKAMRRRRKKGKTFFYICLTIHTYLGIHTYIYIPNNHLSKRRAL